MDKAPPQQRKARNQHLTTEGELWGILACGDALRLEVREFVKVARLAWASGLSTRMRSAVPMLEFPTELRNPEDISSGEVEWLCLLVIEDMEVTEGEVRLKLDHVKDACRKQEASYEIASCSSRFLDAAQFKKVLELISCIMLIDKEYVVSHMAWCLTGRFEMTDTMAALIAISSRKHRQHKVAAAARASEANAESLWAEFAEIGMSALEPEMPDISALGAPFLARDFQIFAHNSSMIERDGLAGVSFGEMVTVYLRVQKKMAQLKEQHAAMRMPAGASKQTPRSAAARFIGEVVDEAELPAAPVRRRSLSPRPSSVRHSLPPRHEEAEEPHAFDGLLGRTEIEILFQELWKTGRMANQYNSPLDMVLSLLRNVGVDKRKSCSGP